MKSRPMNRSPRPMMISPVICLFCFFENIMKNAPIPTRSGAYRDGEMALKLSPSCPSETIQDVIQVPMFAPMMTPTACPRLIIPAFTNPTTITVVAPLLCIMAVTRVPTRTPMRRLFVRIPKSSCIFLPADFWIPSDMLCMP